MRSTIYSPCPKCGDTTLVQHRGASYTCAACNFDYITLKVDEPAREAWMLKALHADAGGKLGVLFLHHAIMGGPLAISNAQVLAFAERHAIPMPTGKPISAGVIAALALLALVALFTIVFALFR